VNLLIKGAQLDRLMHGGQLYQTFHCIQCSMSQPATKQLKVHLHWRSLQQNRSR